MGKTTQAQAGDHIKVRVTYYVLTGNTASGPYTHAGYEDEYGRLHPRTCACSAWIPFGTRFRFTDGLVVECEDRGGGINGEDWIDVWAESRAWGDVNVAKFSQYTEVEVLRWGYGQRGATR